MQDDIMQLFKMRVPRDDGTLEKLPRPQLNRVTYMLIYDVHPS